MMITVCVTTATSCLYYILTMGGEIFGSSQDREERGEPPRTFGES